MSSFLYGLGLSAVYPGLWLYLRDVGAPLEFYAFVLGAYSLGLTLSSPLFGYLFNISYKVPVVISALVIAGASIGYTFADNQWVILVLRLIQGLGAGQIALLMSYSARNSTVSKRTKIIAQLNSSLTLGYVCGPLMATILGFSPSLTIFDRKVHSVALNGILTALTQLVICLMTLIWFREPERGMDMEIRMDEDQRDEYTSNGHYISITHSNLRLILFATGYFIESVVFSAYEMLSVPVGHDIFGWDRVEVGMAWTVVSLICYLTYIVGGSMSNDVSDDIFLYSGLVSQSVGLIGLRHWGKTDWGFIAFGTLTLIGYSSSSLLFEVLFSKDPDTSEIGKFMGILNSIAALARVGGPYFFGYVYRTRGFDFIFLSLATISLTLALASFVVQYIFRYRKIRGGI